MLTIHFGNFYLIIIIIIIIVFLGCDRKKYHDLRDNLDEVHREKVETLIKKWQEAEQRYKLLKASDEDQATNSMTGEYT